MPGIEEQIINDIESATGDDLSTDTSVGNNQDVGSGQREEGNGHDSNAGSSAEDALLFGRDAQQHPAVRGPNKPLAEQTKQERQVGVPEGLYRDKNGRIVDKQNNVYDERGQLVANAGRERKTFEQLERTRAVNTELQRENERLRSSSQFNGSVSPDVLNGLPAKYNIHQDNLEPVMQIAAKFQTDPAGAAREIIQFALSKGLNLRDIVNDELIPDIQAKTLERMLDQRLGPMQRQREQEQQYTQQAEQGRLAAAQFMEQHPEAEVHRADIAGLMNEMRADAEKRKIAFDGPSAALTALTRLRNFCFENGLDPNRNIAEQVEERKGQQPSNRTDGKRPQSPQRGMPMPTGRGGRGTTPMNGNPSKLANANSSMRDIVAESMDELGMSRGN